VRAVTGSGGPERPIRVADEGGVRLVTFARPEVLNAFDRALYEAVASSLSGAAGDDSTRVVVLTGEGRAFSAGQDLGEMARIAAVASTGGATGASGGDGDPSGFSTLLDALVDFPKPLLAAVNGLGVGLGLTMLAHCDLVLVDEGARLRVPFTELGVAPEAASSYLLPLRMGWQAAAHVLLTSEWIDAATAVGCGLAWKACAAGTVLDETMAVARKIAAFPLASLVATKKAMIDAHRDAVRAAVAREGAAFAALLGGAANTDALDAFARRRGAGT